MSAKTRVRSSAQQIKMLTDYMATHPSLAHGEFTGYQGKLREQRQWEDLRITLKEFGPDKTTEQWKVTWRDLRRKARTEGSIANRASQTGNATVVPVLSDLRNNILGVMGTEGALGIRGGEESGVGLSPPVSVEEVLAVNTPFDEEAGPSTESNITTQNEVSIEYAQSSVQPAPSARSRNQTRTRMVTRNERRRQQESRARANQFLQAELETNTVLRNVANQLAIANKISAARVRLTYKEK